jgi:hypothetical protein
MKLWNFWEYGNGNEWAKVCRKYLAKFHFVSGREVYPSSFSSKNSLTRDKNSPNLNSTSSSTSQVVWWHSRRGTKFGQTGIGLARSLRTSRSRQGGNCKGCGNRSTGDFIRGNSPIGRGWGLSEDGPFYKPLWGWSGKREDCGNTSGWAGWALCPTKSLGRLTSPGNTFFEVLPFFSH